MSSDSQTDQTHTPPVKVECRRLGNSGLRVSVPILGGMCFGDPRWQAWVKSEEEASPIMKAAWDLGINTFQTSNVYSNGESERIIGKFMKKYNIPRSQIIILSGCYSIVSENPSDIAWYHPELRTLPQYINQSGLSRASIFNAIEGSLQRLDTPYIDLYQDDLVKMGKVRYVGEGSMWTWQFAWMNCVAERRGWTKFVSMQSQYSLLYREETIRSEVYKSFGMHKYTESDKEIINRVEEIAKKRGWGMGQVALAWVGAKVDSPIVGVTSIVRVHDAVVTGKALTEEEIKYAFSPFRYQSKPVETNL